MSLPLLFVLLLTANDPPLAPPLLLRLFLIWVVIPAAAAHLLRRAFRADVHTSATAIEVARRDVTATIAVDSIARIIAWRLPLPEPGVSLQLQSGQSFRWRLALADPSRLLAPLAATRSSIVESALAHPTLIYARVKAAHGTSSLVGLVGKFAGFALLPASALFYTHQFIAHGGPLGEYYTFGLAAYLTTYAVYWSTITIYLILYASIWRAATELLCLLTAWSAPTHASRVRRWSERFSTALYYLGALVILVLRYVS